MNRSTLFARWVFESLSALVKMMPKGMPFIAQHLDEAQVDLLGFEADVRQHEQEVHLLALDDVVGDQFAKSLRCVFDVRA